MDLKKLVPFPICVIGEICGYECRVSTVRHQNGTEVRFVPGSILSQHFPNGGEHLIAHKRLGDRSAGAEFSRHL